MQTISVLKLPVLHNSMVAQMPMVMVSKTKWMLALTKLEKLNSMAALILMVMAFLIKTMPVLQLQV